MFLIRLEWKEYIGNDVPILFGVGGFALKRHDFGG